LPHVRLVIVGDGPERSALEAAIDAAGLRQVARVTGHRADARALLAGFDVYVNCSTSEGISLSILEAMSATLPVVATRVGGTPEVVMNGETGVLVVPRSAESLATALVGLASSAGERTRLGMAGRMRVVDHFSLATMVDQYHQAYRALGAC
jgi:glycosyltransferase involved in cell wall biosynthesis